MGGEFATSFANIASTSTSNSGLGAILTLTQGISSIASIFSGASQQQQYNYEAENQLRQAELSREDYAIQARQKERDVRRFAARQAMQYAKSGVSLEGSPLLVLQETLDLGQEEIDALRKRGDALYDLYSAQARQMRNTGRNALIGSGFDALSGGLNTYMSGRRLGLFSGNKTSNTVSSHNKGQLGIWDTGNGQGSYSEVEWPSDYA